jgi:hypothetical protein
LIIAVTVRAKSRQLESQRLAPQLWAYSGSRGIRCTIRAAAIQTTLRSLERFSEERHGSAVICKGAVPGDRTIQTLMQLLNDAIDRTNDPSLTGRQSEQWTKLLQSSTPSLDHRRI